MADWRRSPVVAVSVVALFLVVQLAIPISRLGDDGSATTRFGWQMFSVARPAPQFVVVTGADEVEVDLDRFTARVRGDLELTALMPPHLCAVVPDARRVIWEDGAHEC